ncbi:DUF4435 domain-containing protein [Mesorhizobium sp. C416B]|uniref:DUF4435 domain-containing protein n=1 Tax=unclassified Mesorhizobium TaxID=325217 RepID=UPI0003CF0D9B|nr:MULTISPECIES: DUF4435 domain-containing protein [unclassified Mesorhizobium]ESX46668.1 hypothetical protein X762_21525 [Mesorhizobium sp. LSHC426A00]ESX54461.1 hypothetical protein X761_16715 [Mesorhizobium sp. LSHC424B00]ESX72369.1 hypothetical protein X758_14700 [Mesorhizobium sp. LSHC416B00]WJI64495.1 DUF4435 domain-containing protein [Mesorhizobium sp. C416B]
MEGDYAEQLIREARSSIAVFHEFRITYSPGDSAFHAFLEGKHDKHYYLDAIGSTITGSDIEVYVCRGKKELVEVIRAIEDSGIDTDRCLFFADKDNDDLLGLPPLPQIVYVTETYSIENTIVSEEAVRILVGLYSELRRRDAEFKRLLSVLNLSSIAFASRIRPFMAWCIAARSLGEKPNYNNVRLHLIFEIRGDGKVSKRPGAISVFARECGLTDSGVSKALVRTWMRRLPIEGQKTWLRGKFELWFFKELLIGAFDSMPLAARAGELPAILRNRPLLEILAPRIRKPALLRSYLEQRLAHVAAV